MDLKRKIKMQERMITNLQKTNEKLLNENTALRLENEGLLYKNALYADEILEIESLRAEYLSYISKAKEYKDKYKEILYEIKKMRKEDERKINQLNRQFKKVIPRED